METKLTVDEARRKELLAQDKQVPPGGGGVPHHRPPSRQEFARFEHQPRWRPQQRIADAGPQPDPVDKRSGGCYRSGVGAAERRGEAILL